MIYQKLLHGMLRCCMSALILFSFSSIAISQQNPVGSFEHHQDVGDPILKGNTVYNTEDQTYLMSGAGKNIWTNLDQFQFAYKKIKGDFIIKATARFLGKGVAGHRKIGIMARDRLTKDSRYADGALHGGLPLLTSLQYRMAGGDTTGQVIISSIHPTEIEFSRTGDVFTFSTAVYGENYKTVTKQMTLNDEVYVGLYICSHIDTVMEQAIFSNGASSFPQIKISNLILIISAAILK